MSSSETSPTNLALTGYLGAVLAVAVVRFASTPENLRYQLFFLLLAAALVLAGGSLVSNPGVRKVLGKLAARAHSEPGRSTQEPDSALGPVPAPPHAPLLVPLTGVILLLQAAFQPTTEARGYVLAAIGWLSFFLALRLGRERQSLRLLFLALIAIGAGEALYGLLQAVGGVDQIGSYSRNLGRMATGTFINRNHFAGLLNMTLGLSLGALYTGFAARRRGGERRSETFAWTWLVILSCALVGLAIFLSLSRGGSLILIASLVFVFVLLQLRAQRSDRHHTHALPARIAFVLLVATLAVGFTYGIDTLLERFDTIEESERPQIYRDTLELIEDHPWTGIGPGMYGYRFREYQTVGLRTQYSQAHNDYLHVAAEWGLPLAILFWGFVLWCLIRAVRLFLSRASPWRQGIGLGSATAIFTLLLHSLVDFNLQIPANLAVFGAILALSLAAAPAREWHPTEVSAEPGLPSALRQRASLLLLALLALTLLAAGWRVAPRFLAAQIANGTQAPAALERAAAWDPQNPDYPYLLGRYHRDLPGLRNLETARNQLEQAAELAPWGWRAQWELAQLYEVLDQPDQAEQALLRATALSPRDPTLQWQLANLYLRQGSLEKMQAPLTVALSGDRSLWRPGLGLLTKTGLTTTETGLATLDKLWPETRDARLFLMQTLVRDHLAALSADPPIDPTLEDPALPAFLGATWNWLEESQETLTPAEASFYLDYLIKTDRADQARQRWIEVATRNDLLDETYASTTNLVWNGRFELLLTPTTLDWRLGRSEGFEARTTPTEGALDSTALRLDFNGTENLDFSGVRQTVVVQPATLYELSYKARSLDLTTDEGLFLEVWDLEHRQRLLATEETRGTTPWSLVLVTFETLPETTVVELRLRRTRSRQIDNRLAGTYWLDNVSVAVRGDVVGGK